MLARSTLLALFALPAFAQTVYSWEDKDGVHYTDDPSLVPSKARTDATLLSPKVTPRPATPADDSVQVVMDSPTSTQPQQPATQPQQQVVTQRQPPLVAQPTREEPNEQEWRNRFITATRRIETLEKNYSALERSRPQRVECVAQPLVPVGTVRMDPTTGAPIAPAPGSQVVVANGVTTVVNGNTMVNGSPVRPYGPAATCAINAEYDRITREMELTQVELSDARKDLDQLDRDASRYAIPREWRRGW
jgi:hypothetical protein